MSLWDQLDSGDSSTYNKNPIWTIDLNDKENEDTVLRWVNKEFQKLRMDNKERVYEIMRHYKLYKGISSDRINTRNTDRDAESNQVQAQRKVVVNHLYDLTEQIVSRVARYKPAVSVLPTNDEFHDKQASKLAKRLFDHIKYTQNLERKASDMVRHSKLSGEGYLFVEWDKDLGDLHPALKTKDEKLKDVDVKVMKKRPFLDENGNPEKDENGNQIYITEKVKVGDVSFSIWNAERIYFETVFDRDMSKAKYFFRVSERNVDELRADYPKSADKIQLDEDIELEQYYDFKKYERRNSTTVVEFFYKPDKYLAEGRYIKFTPSALLENKIYPYEHGEFPFTCLTDIEVPSEQYGKSFFINGRQIAGQINNLTTMAMRNIKMMSSPKWFMPKGACKLDQLGNNIGVVQYSGAIAPKLVQTNTTPQEVYKFRDMLKQDLQQVSGVFGVSRGEPPTGIKAGVALQFLQEQENERMSNYVSKYNESIRKIADLTLKTCAQYYKEGDQRTIAILGENDEYTRVGFDPRTLARPYDIRIQNSSALPESKAQRIQSTLDLSERFPGLVSQEQVADMLDFGQSEKWYDEATAATRAAERENEEQSEGNGRAPQEWEYHIEHWKVHVTDLQKPGFLNLPEKIQEIKKDHIMAHEMHMQTMTKKNPMYMEKLMTLRQFPLFFTPDTLAPQPDNEPILDPNMRPGVMEQQIKEAEIEATAEQMATAEMESVDTMKQADAMVQSGNSMPMGPIT